MHDYLRAVGFGRIRDKTELQKLLDTVMAHPDREFMTSVNDGQAYAEKSRDFAENAGIAVRGDVDENDVFSYDYYFPYYRGSFGSVTEDVGIEKLAEREEYNGICDVNNLGVSLIFHLNRLGDYSGLVHNNDDPHRCATVNLSALSVKGMVILPVAGNRSGNMQKRSGDDAKKGVIAAVMDGDQNTLENLTLEDIDLYTTISRRVQTEDVLSIVESYFMPYGISCDHYSVMGEILAVEQKVNQLTGEKLYQMLVECNDIDVDICINAEDLFGEPEEGRRFRGTIWLQGEFE